MLMQSSLGLTFRLLWRCWVGIEAVEKRDYYILFANYTQGLAMHELLKGAGLKARIAPTPRSVQGELSCGMSLLVQ